MATTQERRNQEREAGSRSDFRASERDTFDQTNAITASTTQNQALLENRRSLERMDSDFGGASGGSGANGLGGAGVHLLLMKLRSMRYAGRLVKYSM